MKELRGKVAVVTGAASGIGRALAGRFAAEGMKVVLADVEGPALAKAESELRAGGATVLAVAADVARAEAVDALAARTLEAFGGVHVLCNNAGVYASGLSWERPLADWEWVLGVNLWGVIHGVRAFVPIMLRQGSEAHIVNTASVAGLISGPFSAPYNVSKYGVVALSESLHYELALAGRAGEGVRPLPRLGEHADRRLRAQSAGGLRDDGAAALGVGAGDGAARATDARLRDRPRARGGARPRRRPG